MFSIMFNNKNKYKISVLIFKSLINSLIIFYFNYQMGIASRSLHMHEQFNVNSKFRNFHLMGLLHYFNYFYIQQFIYITFSRNCILNIKYRILLFLKSIFFYNLFICYSILFIFFSFYFFI